MRIGLVLEVTTSFQYSKHWIEIRIWSVGQDNSQSCCIRRIEESDQSSSTQSNSTAGRRWSNSILENEILSSKINSHKYSIGLVSVSNLVWQQEEVQKGDISIALIIREQSFTSELFRDTLGIISLILPYRTM